MNAEGIDAHQLFAEPEEVIPLGCLPLAIHTNRRKVTGPLHHHHTAGGMLRQSSHKRQLLVQGRGDQIKRPTHHQQRNRQRLAGAVRPDQPAKAVEPHHRPGRRSHCVAFEHTACRKLALQQFREVGEGQARQSRFTALLHPRHWLRPTG